MKLNNSSSVNISVGSAGCFRAQTDQTDIRAPASDRGRPLHRGTSPDLSAADSPCSIGQKAANGIWLVPTEWDTPQKLGPQMLTNGRILATSRPLAWCVTAFTWDCPVSLKMPPAFLCDLETDFDVDMLLAVVTLLKTSKPSPRSSKM